MDQYGVLGHEVASLHSLTMSASTWFSANSSAAAAP
jgi:hypothetical protein